MEQENILIVDDTPENLRILSDLLAEQGYRARPVLSGRMALKGARSLTPDLVLLDIHMPEMDGYTVCRKLKEQESTAAVPVIFISALNEILDKVKAFEVGGVDYITKPFQFEEVLARVQTHLTISRLQKELEARIEEKSLLNHKLQKALGEIKTLGGLLPICCFCKKIRDDEGYWHQLETYIRDHSGATFSHGICKECAQEHYPELVLPMGKNKETP